MMIVVILIKHAFIFGVAKLVRAAFFRGSLSNIIPAILRNDELTSGSLCHSWTSDSHVSLHVEGEVVGAGEGPFTEATLERSISRVLPVVTCQLV
jgi:hypothetical protein